MSYGGYAALAGAAFTPNLYACAISVNGVSDLQALLEAKVLMREPGYRTFSTAMSEWTERVGSPTDAASPGNHRSIRPGLFPYPS